MSKRLITCVASACAFPVLLAAQASPVEIYGTLLPFLDNVQTSGATAAGLSPATGGASLVAASAYTGINLPGRNRITSGTSNLGFRGGYIIDGNLKVVFQIESAVSPDGDAPNTLAGRNSRLGLEGSWGTVFYGNWDTPYKYPLLAVGPLRGLSPFDNALTASPGFNVPGTTTQTGRINGKADAAFNRRQGNSVQYWSPDMSGLSFRLAYSVNEGRTVASPTAPSISPDILSGLVSYKSGPLVVSLGYERHNDYFGLSQLGGSAGGTLANAGSHDEGQELVASWTFSTGTKISGIVENLTYNTDDTVVGNVNQYKRAAWYALLQQRFGPHQLFASFGQASNGSCTKVGGAAASTDGLAGRQFSLGYTYSLSKAADIFVSYYGMNNDRSASYAVFPSPGTVAPGASTKGFGVGLLYAF
jgi:predicted porin